MKSYVYLIFIIFSFCIDANEMDAPPSYHEFKTTIQNLNISSEAEYVQFFITEGRELGFPSLKQIPKIYADEWKGWDDLFKNANKDSQDSSRIPVKESGSRWLTYNSFITLMRTEGIDNSEDYRNWYLENRDFFNVPEYPEEVYPKFKNWGRELQEAKTQPEQKPSPKKDSQVGPLTEQTQSVQKPSPKKDSQVGPLTEQTQSVQKPSPKKKVRTINKKPVSADNQKKRVRPSRPVKKYLSYTELKKRVQDLGITSFSEYRRRYKEIVDAPANPDQIYKKEWESWPAFLGKQKQQYLSYTELQKKVQDLGIKSRLEYLSRYKEIDGAPSDPAQKYKKEWEGWLAFLGKSSHRQHRQRSYLSYTELQKKVQDLGITSFSEYRRRYKEIVDAPANPDQIYKKEWESWPAFLGKKKRQYLSYTELQKKVQALGIKSRLEYLSRYKEIVDAPANPNQKYKKEWEGWLAFLGKSSRHNRPYLSYTELQKKVQDLGITSFSEYRRRYKEIVDAPANPDQKYKKEWEGWLAFLGKSSRHNRPYLSYTELQKKVQDLGITSFSEYRRRYKEIDGAPSSPDKKYKKEWEGWLAFLGKNSHRQRPYLSYTELQKKVQDLGITSFSEYRRRYKEISNAPSSPNQIYKEEWKDWYAFLGINSEQKRQRHREQHRLYLSYTELKKQVRALGITSESEYNREYKKIPKAPSRPDRTYKGDWEGWPAFLGTSSHRKKRRNYLPYTKLQKQVQALGIASFSEYRRRYKEISNAPANPDRYYKEEWNSWPAFLGKKCKEQFR